MKKTTISIDDEQVRKMLIKAPAFVKAHTKKFLYSSSTIVGAKWTTESPSGTDGRLKVPKIKVDTWKAEVSPTVDYALYVEGGTRPHWTSVDNLKDWAKLRGINPYALQKSIARKGTKANPFIERTYESSIPKIKKLAEKMLRDIVNNMARSV